MNSLIKWKIGVKMTYGNLACWPLADEFAEFIPFFSSSLDKKKIFNEGAQLATAVFSEALINLLIQLITLIETVFN